MVISGTSLSRQSLALVLTTNKNQTHKTKYSDPMDQVLHGAGSPEAAIFLMFELVSESEMQFLAYIT